MPRLDYLELLAEVYLRMPIDDIPAVLRAYASDQLRDVVEYERNAEDDGRRRAA